MLELPRSETSSRVAQLERPQEIARLLEVGSDGENLMNQVLHTHDTVLPQMIFNDLVIGKRDPLLVDLAIAALVDEFADGLEVGIAVGDVGFDDFEHLRRGFCEADEDAIVDLEETEELEGLSWFRSHLGDTRDDEDKHEAGAASRGRSSNTYPLMRTTKTSLGSAGT